MCAPERWSITWSTPEGQLEAREPTRAEVEVVAAYLSAWYNDDHNRAMMSNEEAMASDEVRAHYDSVWEEGGRNFLLYAGGSLVGDAICAMSHPKRTPLNLRFSSVCATSRGAGSAPASH